MVATSARTRPRSGCAIVRYQDRRDLRQCGEMRRGDPRSAPTWRSIIRPGFVEAVRFHRRKGVTLCSTGRRRLFPRNTRCPREDGRHVTMHSTRRESRVRHRRRDAPPLMLTAIDASRAERCFKALLADEIHRTCGRVCRGGWKRRWIRASRSPMPASRTRGCRRGNMSGRSCLRRLKPHRAGRLINGPAPAAARMPQLSGDRSAGSHGLCQAWCVTMVRAILSLLP